MTIELTTFALVVLILAVLGALRATNRRRKENEELQANIDNLTQELASCRIEVNKRKQESADREEVVAAKEAELEQLRPFRKVLDAAKEAEGILARASTRSRQILDTANTDADRVKQAARNERDRLQAEATADRLQAKELRSSAKSKGEEIIRDAHTTSERIIEQAEEQAKNTAQEALEAKRNADSFEAALKAMKNAVKGYGDEYIIPNHHTLDDLAEEFSHKDGGKRLQECRSVSKSMVKAGKAADCDYVDPHRRETAIKFVSDAFNGKVDTVMSKVKRDNFGKLKQQILDAYALVNHHGSAFRNARITDIYLQARLKELQWAVATEELRQTEREEQAAIKAQIREEERARKEFEKAQKEAEKEERMLEKAMEKARKEMAKASEEERSQYEDKLKELQQKWEEAEAKNQRAISMAQQTKRGHVYVISNIGSFGENVVKVGMTRRLDPLDRVRELGDASVPFNFDVHAMIYSEDAPRLENELHKRFGYCRMNRVNLRREFFQVSPNELKQVTDELGIEAHWTMKAEAAQYRESLVIIEQEKASLIEQAVV